MAKGYLPKVLSRYYNVRATYVYLEPLVTNVTVVVFSDYGREADFRCGSEITAHLRMERK